MLTATKAPSRVIEKVRREGDYLFFNSEYAQYRLSFKTANILRVQITKDEFDTLSKPGVILETVISDFTYEEKEDCILVKSDEIALRVSTNSGAFTYLDKAGNLLLTEDEKAPVEFEKYQTYVLTGDNQKTEKIITPDGEKTVIKDGEKLYNGDSYHITWHPVFSNEAHYGLGQHEEGYGNLRGKTIYVHQANRKIAVPMLVSTKGYGILMDTYSPIIYNDSYEKPYIFNESAHEWEYFFVKGENLDEVIKGYRILTGKASLLPKWAYGYVQSKERYENENQILEAVKESRKRGLGLDCIVLDWLSWDDGKWGQKTFDKSRFGHAKEMIDKLHEDNVHFMISLWPTVDPSCDNHREFKENNLLINASTLYNPFEAKGREIYWKQLMEEHWPSGVDAWWCDSSEPITPEWNVRTRPEASALYHEYCREVGLRFGDEYSNAFSLYHAQGIYEGQRNEMASNPTGPQKRVCNLTRSAYTGQQRFGTIMWSGDISASWDTFKRQIGTGLNFSASGLPYWTVDVGAFFVKPGDFWFWDGEYENPATDLGYHELYTRWYQWAAFLPVFRCHGTDCEREMWAFGDKGNMFYDAMVSANRLRYELMPYIYSEAGKSWLYDTSIMSNLSFSFAEDENVWDITDQYMFGEAIMACPVTRPMYYDVNSKPLDNKDFTRRVYLPKGNSWFDFYTKEKYEGGQWINVTAPIEKIPLFVKNGSIIPMTDFAMSTAEQTGDVRFEVYSDHDCEYKMYSDAGDGYGYEKGEFEVKTVAFRGGVLRK